MDLGQQKWRVEEAEVRRSLSDQHISAPPISLIPIYISIPVNPVAAMMTRQILLNSSPSSHVLAQHHALSAHFTV